MLQKILYEINAIIIKQHNPFQYGLFEHQISILEWFLKDHGRTGAMVAENSTFYIQIENSWSWTR